MPEELRIADCLHYPFWQFSYISKVVTFEGKLHSHKTLQCRYLSVEPIPVAVRSKAWVFGRSLTGIVGSNSTGGMDVCLL
jgi:hypothetical protein